MSEIDIQDKQKENLIRFSEVQRRTGYGKAWIYRLIKNGQFPKQVKTGIRSIAFIESEIDTWIVNKISESRTEIMM